MTKTIIVNPETTLERLEREALTNAERETAAHIAATGRKWDCSGQAFQVLSDGTVLWVTATSHGLIVKTPAAGKSAPSMVKIGIKGRLAYIRAYTYWLEDGEDSAGVSRDEALILLEASLLEAAK